MRPRARRSAGRNALITDSEPNTLTSNSRRMASRERTSNGPGVKIPALLTRRSRPPPHGVVVGDVAAGQAHRSARRLLEVSDLFWVHRRAENPIMLGGETKRDISPESAAGAGHCRRACV